MGDSFWTSYSDLFVGMSVIFLVLFFFATLRAGVLQMQAFLDKKTHEEALKGAVPKEVAEKTQQQREHVKNTLNLIQAKKDELTKLSQRLNDEQETFNDVLKDQETKAAQLKSAYDTNLKLDSQVRDLSSLKSKLEDGLREKDDAIANLGRKMRDVETARAELERTVSDLNSSLRDKDAQLETHRQKIESLRADVQAREAAVAEARNALANEQSRTARLYEELQKNSRELDRALGEATKARSEMELLKQDVNARDGQIARLKSELGDEARAMEALRGELNARDGKIRDLADLTDRLRGELTGRDRKIAELDADAAEALRQIGGLKRAVEARDSALAKMGREEDGLRDAIAKRDGRLEDLKGELGLEKQKEAGLKTEISDREGQIGRLNDALKGIQRDLAGRDADLDRLRGELGDTKRRAAADRAELDGRDRQIARLKNELGDINHEIKGRDGALDKLERRLADANKELGDVRDDRDRLKRLYADATGGSDAKDRKIASLGDELRKAKDEVGELSLLRRQIAGGVLNNLRNHGVDVAVDPDSGILTLSMDEVFQFKNGSYEITDTSKKKIKAIMPIYAQSLFGNAAQASKIADVIITGHASPRYKRRYVDPKGFDRVAYIYNLDLSMNRAHQVAAYIFGDQIGSYPHKQELKLKTSVAGKGYMEPIAKGPDGDRTEPCGPYDCPRSRRVEINFILKEVKPRNVLATYEGQGTAPPPLEADMIGSRLPAATPPSPAQPGTSNIYGPPPPPGWSESGR